MIGGLQLETDDIREAFAVGAVEIGDSLDFDAARRAFDAWLLRFKEDAFNDGYWEGQGEGYADGYAVGVER